MLVIAASVFVSAADSSIMSSELIDKCSCSVTANSNGLIDVYFSTNASSTCTSIGAKYVDIQKYTNGSWSTVYTYKYTTTSSLIASNKSRHSKTLTYSNTTSGSTYRAYITYYASTGSVSETRYATTSSVAAR